MMMIILDGTIVTVALPEIQRDLGFSSSGLAWVVNAYLIAFGGLLLLAGRLGDLIGGKRVFLAGLAVFIAASLLCGLSVSQPMLIAARFAQGAGGAMASAVSLGMIVRLFPEPPLRARALGIYSFTGAGGASVGLVLGGVLTQALSWHWIFFVNMPIGVVAIAAGGRLLGRGAAGMGLRAGADAAGAVLVTAGLMVAVYAVVETPGTAGAPRARWSPAPPRSALLAAFFARQHLARTPLLPLRILRSRSVAGGERRAGAHGGGGVRVPGADPAVHAAGPRLRCGRCRRRDAARRRRDRRLSAGLSARLIARFGLRAMLMAGLAPIVAGFALLPDPAAGRRAPIRCTCCRRCC